MGPLGYYSDVLDLEGLSSPYQDMHEEIKSWKNKLGALLICVPLGVVLDCRSIFRNHCVIFAINGKQAAKLQLVALQLCNFPCSSTQIILFIFCNFRSHLSFAQHYTPYLV